MRLYSSVLASFRSPAPAAGKFNGGSDCWGIDAPSLVGMGDAAGMGTGAPGGRGIAGDASGEDGESAGDGEAAPLCDKAVLAESVDELQAASSIKGIRPSTIRICQYLAAIANFLFTVFCNIKLI